jgi:hypothetical protein
MSLRPSIRVVFAAPALAAIGALLVVITIFLDDPGGYISDDCNVPVSSASQAARVGCLDVFDLAGSFVGFFVVLTFVFYLLHLVILFTINLFRSTDGG